MINPPLRILNISSLVKEKNALSLKLGPLIPLEPGAVNNIYDIPENSS